MAKRLKIVKGSESQIIWADDFPKMQRNGWSIELPNPERKTIVEVIKSEEDINDGNI